MALGHQSEQNSKCQSGRRPPLRITREGFGSAPLPRERKAVRQSPLLPPPVPDELRPIALFGGEQGGGEGLGQARVVEDEFRIEEFHESLKIPEKSNTYGIPFLTEVLS